MATLTFEALLQVFQRGESYQEVIKHGLSDILRAEDDAYLPLVTVYLDRAAVALDRRQAEAEIQAALETLETATGLAGVRRPPNTQAPPLSTSALKDLPPADEQKGYYVASLLWTVNSLLSKYLGQQERSKQAASNAIGMLYRYRLSVQAHLKSPSIYYPPSIAHASSTSKSKLSLNQWLNQEQNALHKMLKQWLGVSAVKSMIWDYSR